MYVPQDQQMRVEEETFAILKPDSASKHKEIIDRMYDAGLKVTLRTLSLSKEVARAIVESTMFPESGAANRGAAHHGTGEVLTRREQHSRNEFIDAQVSHLIMGTSVAIVAESTNAVQVMAELCGPADPEEARRTHPTSLRAVYGEDIVRNAVHCATTQELAARHIQLVFGYETKKKFVIINPSAGGGEDRGAHDDESSSESDGDGATKVPPSAATMAAKRRLREQKRLLRLREIDLLAREQALMKYKEEMESASTSHTKIEAGRGSPQRQSKMAQLQANHTATVVEAGGPVAAEQPRDIRVPADPMVWLNKPETLRMLFAQYDTDGNGVMSKREFFELYQQTEALHNFGVPGDTDDVLRRLAQYGSNSRRPNAWEGQGETTGRGDFARLRSSSKAATAFAASQEKDHLQQMMWDGYLTYDEFAALMMSFLRR